MSEQQPTYFPPLSFRWPKMTNDPTRCAGSQFGKSTPLRCQKVMSIAHTALPLQYPADITGQPCAARRVARRPRSRRRGVRARASCAWQSSRSPFRPSAWLRRRRKRSHARAVTFVRSARSRTASGHARSRDQANSRSCRRRRRRWISRRQAMLRCRHLRRPGRSFASARLSSPCGRAVVGVIAHRFTVTVPETVIENAVTRGLIATQDRAKPWSLVQTVSGGRSSAQRTMLI